MSRDDKCLMCACAAYVRVGTAQLVRVCEGHLMDASEYEGIAVGGGRLQSVTQ